MSPNTIKYQLINKPLRLSNNGQELERQAIKWFKEAGYDVINMTSGCYLFPDLFVFSEGISEAAFIECKCYRSCNTLKKAIAKWSSGQPRQYEFQKEMLWNHMPCITIVQTETETHIL